MNRGLKTLAGLILIITVMTQDKICKHTGLDQARFGRPLLSSQMGKSNSTLKDFQYGSILSVYSDLPDKQGLDLVPVMDSQSFQKREQGVINEMMSVSQPINVEWQTLISISYKLKYFPELETEMYSPVFSDRVKALDRKEIMIKGFVIPFDEFSDTLALSANPFASCFFCGKASPASVISMYLQDKGKRYKVDDVRTFRGNLYLNYDDPNEYYYILRNARVE